MNGMKGLATLWPLLALIVIFYFLLIRPQKKKEKAVTAMRNALKVGDEIVTIGGICGKVMKVKEETVTISVGADKTKFEIMKWAVSKVVSESETTSSSITDSEPLYEDEEENDIQVKKSLPKRIKKKESEQEIEAETEPEEPANISE